MEATISYQSNLMPEKILLSFPDSLFRVKYSYSFKKLIISTTMCESLNAS